MGEKKDVGEQFFGPYVKGDYVENLMVMQNQLMKQVPHDLPKGMDVQLTAGLGIIEETMEYLSAVGRKPWRPIPKSREEQLEEITDILFYYLELVILSGFTWEQICKEYKRKWKVNMERYEKGSKGDYSWDERLKGKEEL